MRSTTVGIQWLAGSEQARVTDGEREEVADSRAKGSSAIGDTAT